MFYNNEIVQNDLEDIFHRDIPWEKLKHKNVLITGANGMLASYIVYMLEYLNINHHYEIRIFALVRNREEAEKRFYGTDITLLVQDVCDEINIKDNVDYIIHAAGNASPKFILQDPVGIIHANTLGTINVMEFARKNNVTKVLYTSTREIYGKTAEGINAVKEKDMGSLDCHTLRACYPESKRMSETILYSYYEQYKIPYTIVRIAHSYGPGMKIDNDGRVMADFISDIVNNRDIVMKSEGTVERAFCYVSDAIAGMFVAMLKGEDNEAYNIANETESIMIREVAQMLVDLFPERGLKVCFKIPEQMSVGYSRMGRTRLDTRKLEKLQWKCNVQLKEGLEKTVRSFER